MYIIQNIRALAVAEKYTLLRFNMIKNLINKENQIVKTIFAIFTSS